MKYKWKYKLSRFRLTWTELMLCKRIPRDLVLEWAGQRFSSSFFFVCVPFFLLLPNVTIDRDFVFVIVFSFFSFFLFFSPCSIFLKIYCRCFCSPFWRDHAKVFWLRQTFLSLPDVFVGNVEVRWRQSAWDDVIIPSLKQPMLNRFCGIWPLNHFHFVLLLFFCSVFLFSFFFLLLHSKIFKLCFFLIWLLLLPEQLAVCTARASRSRWTWSWTSTLGSIP